jgi:hypothetical protein
VSLAPGRQLSDLEFRIAPRGTIAGKVVDRDGEPVRHASLFLVSIGLYGEERATGGHNYLSDDRGEFRVYDLEPGKYCLLAVPPIRLQACCTPEALAGNKRAATSVLPTYYPSAQDLASAAVVDLPAGQEVTGIRITLREAPVYRVRGKIAGGLPGTLLTDLTLMLFPQGFSAAVEPELLDVLAQRIGNPRAVASDGTFNLVDVEPGVYDLMAMHLNSRARGPFGRTEVVVADQEVKDVVLPIGSALKLAVALSIEGAEKADLSAGVMLWPLDGNILNTPNGTLDTAGHGQVDGILPGLYRPWISGRLKNVYFKSARLRTAVASQDVLQSGLLMDDATSGATLEVVLGRDGGTVSGILRKGDEPAPNRQMDLVPDVPNPERSPNRKSVQSDDGGQFLFTGVAPGDYRLYAWDDLYASVSLQFDAHFRRRYQDSGVKVSVRAGQNTEVEAKVMEAR